MNTLGRVLRLTTFGESHGLMVGGILEGVPAGLVLDMDLIQVEVDRRKSMHVFTTPRQEPDRIELVSGVFEGKSTGAPIALLVHNHNIKSKDYDNLRESFRPGHADFTTFSKYGLRDHRGGGRSSARESVIRVGAGAIAKLLLQELGLEVVGGVFSIGGIEAKAIDFDFAKQSVIFSLSPEVEAQQKQAILEAKQKGDSLGGVVLVQARAHANLLGLGQPLYDKLDARIAGVMMGLNGVKGVFIGDPHVSSMQGSHYNDPISPQGFKSNHSGGILGGLGNGSDLVVWVHFKPTSSIAHQQESINTQGQAVHLELKGRHDPCIAIRGSVVCESLLALILADFLLLNLGSQLNTLKGFYRKAWVLLWILCYNRWNHPKRGSHAGDQFPNL